jgi:hypothetical protein
MINCRARAAEIGLSQVKIVGAEYNYDGSRLTFLFNTEGEEKVDLKSLKKDMHDLYPNTHVEMRQIGPRDVAKIIGGMGACGLETRCCSKFLTDFISIKMAKEQAFRSLPNEITECVGRAVALSMNTSNMWRRRTIAQAQYVWSHPRGKARDVLPGNKVIVLFMRGRQTLTEIFTSRIPALGGLRHCDVNQRRDRHESGG